MNWEAIGAVAEIFGAVAVVITLIYLAIQIRQNTKVARSATRQAIAQMAMASGADLASNGELAELFTRDLEGAELEPSERLRLLARWYVALRHWENIHYQYLSGMLSEDEWRGFRLNLKVLFQMKSAQTYWSNESTFYSSAFQNEVTAIQKELASTKEGKGLKYVLSAQNKDDA